MDRIKLLIVDDSPLMCEMLENIILQDKSIEVIGHAHDPYEAREKIKLLNPDILTLDVEMPRMDGVTFLKNIMRLRPMPVVMISSLTAKGADVTLEALEVGAVDFVTKPNLGGELDFERYAASVREKVKLAATMAKVKQTHKPATTHKTVSSHSVLQQQEIDNNKIFVIGASTGGVEALQTLLRELPAHMPAIIIAQHIPEEFSIQFAKRVNESTKLKIVIPENGQSIEPNTVYVARGGEQLTLEKQGVKYVFRTHPGTAEEQYRPSIDRLFTSTADTVGDKAIGIILTGMGNDGAQGLKMISEKGGYTIAQDQASSMIWSMPNAAIANNAVKEVLSLDNIASRMCELSNVANVWANK
ncbi:MAG: chemotaxis response regulator protein-glutamate methylesterase [Gammaproteobacteria bacterium]